MSTQPQVNGFTRVLRGTFQKALVLENPHATLDGFLEEQGIEVHRLSTPPTSEDELIELLRNGRHNLIYKRSRVQITRRVVESSPDLLGVMLCCIGDDSVDKEACAEHGVLVTNDPISNGRSVVELVLGEMLCMARRVFEAVEQTNANNWQKNNRARYELRGKTLGVIGLGNIGKQVAQAAEVLGMNIVFFDTREVAQEVGRVLGWKEAGSMREAMELSHVVTLHLSAHDYRDESNEGILTRDDLMQLGTRVEVPGPKLFLNASRGVLYEAQDLVAAVDAGAIDYAFVDVFPQEPHHKGETWQNPFASSPNIYATPHIGAATQEAQPRIARHVAATTRMMNFEGRVRNLVFSPKFPIGVQGFDKPRYILAVLHSDKRGTKRAIDETIYEAGLSNLSSAHRDIPKYGIAYDVNILNGSLNDEQLQDLIRRASQHTNDPKAIRAIRMIER